MSEGLFSDPRVDRVIEALHAVPGWPADPAKDDAYVRKLMAEYPYLDLEKEAGKWGEWLMGQEEAPKNWFLKFRTWLSNDRRWGIERRSNRAGAGRGSHAGDRKEGAGGARPTSTAGTFGAYKGSGRLDDW